MTPKPESETDPWKDVWEIEISDSTGGGFFYRASAVDAARAAEAAQHQQEIMAKDETIGRWTQTGLTLMKFFAAFPVMNESDMPEFLWREVPTLIRSARQAAAKAEARLAAVEAERDQLKALLDAMADVKTCATTDQVIAAEMDAAVARAERDRLKAALQGLQSDIEHDAHVNQPEAFRNYWRGRLHSEIAVLTPQGQSTDGETR